MYMSMQLGRPVTGQHSGHLEANVGRMQGEQPRTTHTPAQCLDQTVGTTSITFQCCQDHLCQTNTTITSGSLVKGELGSG